MRTILIAAAAVALSGVAYAQSGVSTPGDPGSGYRIPESQATGQQRPGQVPGQPPVQSGEGVVNPAVPGSGYMAPQSEGRQVPATPKGEGVENPAVPGSGFSTR
jgi:hypothetical protein